MPVRLEGEDRTRMTRYLAFVAKGRDVRIFVENHNSGFWMWRADVACHEEVDLGYVAGQLGNLALARGYMAACDALRVYWQEIEYVQPNRDLSWTVVQADLPIGGEFARRLVGGRPGLVLVAPVIFPGDSRVSGSDTPGVTVYFADEESARIVSWGVDSIDAAGDDYHLHSSYTMRARVESVVPDIASFLGGVTVVTLDQFVEQPA